MLRADSKWAALAIFAKAPVAGYAKTRLISELGADGAADLQRALIELTVETACRSGFGKVTLWCAPSADHEFFVSLAAEHSLELHDQTGDDLGARMHQAFLEMTRVHPTVLIGTDCPALASADLTEAASALLGGADAVITPAEDGGYVLIGLSRPAPQLFEGMPWGTSTVMAETRARARLAGLRMKEFDPLWDVDRPEDLCRLREWSSGRNRLLCRPLPGGLSP